jgi:hypothetical protein
MNWMYDDREIIAYIRQIVRSAIHLSHSTSIDTTAPRLSLADTAKFIVDYPGQMDLTSGSDKSMTQ